MSKTGDAIGPILEASKLQVHARQERIGSGRSLPTRFQGWLLLLATILSLTGFSTLGAASAGGEGGEGLHALALEPLPLGAIRPTGWLEEQLRIQADGLSGHLDEFWPDIKESGWIGGTAEGWERMPYWLDGVVPLVYQVELPELRTRVTGYIDYILEHQQPDGWLGPRQSATGNYKERDPWPVFVMLKVLTQYQEATSDERVILAMQKFLKTLHAQLKERSLFDWNRMRWQDGVLSVYWLYDRTGEAWLLDLARIMKQQGYDWRGHFADLPHKEKVQKWEHESHVVNNAMGVKAPGVWYRQSVDPVDAQSALGTVGVLDRYHGQASGLFSGDECFAGLMPSQGTETCAVVEYMFSLETLSAVLGYSSFGDRLEAITYNGLPAAFKPDMWGRQYVQQANQVVVRVSDDRLYTTNGPRSNVFGLETNYGCCTANMHQGWPKFVGSLWMRTPEGGLAAVAYGPAIVRTKVKGVDLVLDVKTDYPFSDEILINVQTGASVSFPLKLRVPHWTRGATLEVDGEVVESPRSGGYAVLNREWAGNTPVRLKLPMRLWVERRFNNSATVHRGPLVFSLRVGEYWKQIAGEAPYGDWEVYPTTVWNYAIQLNEEEPEESFEVEAGPVDGNPFNVETTPVRLFVKGRMVPEWVLEKNAAAPPPVSPVTSRQPLTKLTLVPYGAAKLRVTELPVLAAD